MLVPLIWWAEHVPDPFHFLFAAAASTDGSPAHADSMKSPGATTSGLIRPSYVGPRELKYASRLQDGR